MEKKVSLVTPCYNGESYLARYLDCILLQDYSNIELILINDGSTDNTEEIYFSYVEKLERKGVICKYVKQKNIGLAGAVNVGIKHVTGEYLAWPDADDILLSNFVSSRVSALEEHPNAGLVVCPVEKVDESCIEKVIGKANIFDKWNSVDEKNIYNDVLRLQNILVFPGSFMVRTSFFKETNPKLDFPHPKEIGQDFQMLLPISYKYKACYTKEVSFRYVIRKNSHSHTYKTKEELIEKYKIGKELLLNLMEIIPFINEREKLDTLKMIEWRYQRWLMDIGLEYNDFSLYEEGFSQIKKIEALDFYSMKEYYRFKYSMINNIFLCLSKFKRMILSK